MVQNLTIQWLVHKFRPTATRKHEELFHAFSFLTVFLNKPYKYFTYTATFMVAMVCSKKSAKKISKLIPAGLL